MTEIITDPAQIGPSDLVVDAGSGVGGTAIYLAKRFGCRVIGVNLSRHQIEIAARKTEEAGLSERVKFVEGNCSRWIPVDSKTVDVIVNIETACHYGDRETYVKECARILKGGGQMVAQDCIARDAVEQSELIAPMCDAWCLQFPLETPSSYSELLGRNGFEVIESVDLGSGLKPTIDAFRIFSAGLLKRAFESLAFTSDHRAWKRQFDTIARAYDAGHFTSLRLHARLLPANVGASSQ